MDAMNKLIPGTKEHFYTKFIPDENGCWIWQKEFNSTGYGRYVIKLKKFLAHRFSYELHKSSIPNKMCVLHICDNPKCVNPDHMKLGTQSDNMKDAAIKNRMDRINKLKGEQVPNSILSNLQVKELKIRLMNGEIGMQLAKEFNVTKTTIYNIKNGKWWKHINTD